MSADLLRRAAAKLRATAVAATPGPWGVGNGTHVVRDVEQTGAGSFTCIGSVAEMDDETDRDLWADNDPERYAVVYPECDAEYIALMHPPVALALADVLESAAVAPELIGRESNLLVELPQLARAILREES